MKFIIPDWNESIDEYYDYEHLESIEKLLEDDNWTDQNAKFFDKFNKRSSNKNKKYNLINRRIDTNKIRHKIANNLEVHTSICKNIKFNENDPIRSGAIIYTHCDGKTYFCMGVDSCYGDLTDFAGGVKKGETPLQGGLRELEEESIGIFKLNEEDVSDNVAFYCNNMMIMFIHLKVDTKKIQNEFQERHKKLQRKINVGEFSLNSEPEVSNIVWLERNDFIDSINGKGRRIYSRVRKILSRVTDVIQVL